MSNNFLQTAIVWTSSGAMTSTNVITSQAINLSKFTGCSFQPKWIGTPTGTFAVLVSNDYGTSPALTNAANPTSVATWTLLPGSSVPGNPSGSAGNTFVPNYASCAAFMVLQYTNASGSGTASGFIAGKENG